VLQEARCAVDLSPVTGAAAITTSGFPIDRQLMADLLMQRRSAIHSCIAAVDYITATYSAVELLFLHLGWLVQIAVRPVSRLSIYAVLNAGADPPRIMPQKTQSGPDRAYAPPRSQDRRRARMMKRHHAQHALYRHERQRSVRRRPQAIALEAAAYCVCLRPCASIVDQR
jgi:argininosuccinate lyase